MKKWAMIVFSAFVLFSARAAAQSPLEIYSEWFYYTAGADLDSSVQPWAWLEMLERGDLGPDDTVHVYLWYDESAEGEYHERWVWEEADVTVEKAIDDFILSFTTRWPEPLWEEHPYPPYDAWDFGAMQGSVKMSTVLYRYADVISEESLGRIEEKLVGIQCSRDWPLGSENSQSAGWVARYLQAERDPDACHVRYSYDPPPNTNVYEFTWDGRTYTPGGEYNAYELARDILYYHMYTWVTEGNDELDSPDYTRYIIHAFVTLHEFALDEEMKKRAKMTADFLFLEAAMDHSAEQWGGALGRPYGHIFTAGVLCFPWRVYFDDEHRHATCATGDFPDALFGSYNLPELIQDVGDYRDEPDGYWHINKETFMRNKWTYVTKFFNLGGSRRRSYNSTDAWLANARTNDAYPFNFWINLKNGEDEWAPGDQPYLARGEDGYQYRYAVLVPPWDAHLRDLYFHAYLSDSNPWDETDEADGWQFFREDRTMVAVKVAMTAAMEMAVEGVDYSSLDAFKYAVLGNASLDGNIFVTSRGDTIVAQKPGETWPVDDTNLATHPDENGWEFFEAVKVSGDSEFHWVWDFPFAKRIETIDNEGNHIVDWVDNVVTVQRHGRSCTYDFNTWTYEGDCEFGGDVPPSDEDGVETVEPAPDTADAADAGVDVADDLIDDAGDVSVDAQQDTMDAQPDTAEPPAETEGGCSCSMAS